MNSWAARDKVPGHVAKSLRTALVMGDACSYTAEIGCSNRARWAISRCRLVLSKVCNLWEPPTVSYWIVNIVNSLSSYSIRINRTRELWISQ